jgi:hypothetical protein
VVDKRFSATRGANLKSHDHKVFVQPRFYACYTCRVSIVFLLLLCFYRCQLVLSLLLFDQQSVSRGHKTSI